MYSPLSLSKDWVGQNTSGDCTRLQWNKWDIAIHYEKYADDYVVKKENIVFFICCFRSVELAPGNGVNVSNALSWEMGWCKRIENIGEMKFNMLRTWWGKTKMHRGKVTNLDVHTLNTGTLYKAQMKKEQYYLSKTLCDIRQDLLPKSLRCTTFSDGTVRHIGSRLGSWNGPFGTFVMFSWHVRFVHVPEWMTRMRVFQQNRTRIFLQNLWTTRKNIDALLITIVESI